MADRKYSVAEIDRMRKAIDSTYYLQAPAVEDRLRTYMLNGTDPEELERAMHAHYDQIARKAKTNS